MKMKEYCVYFDITVTGHVYVEANDEEEAKRIADEKVGKEPYYYANNFDSVSGARVIEAIKEEEEEE